MTSAVTARRSGGHQVLLLVYAVFAVSAGARSAVQLATGADEAPLAYSLSLAAAVTYALGWLAIRRAAEGRTGFASWLLWVELAGVLGVGTFSVLDPERFPEPTVWSDYGVGYGFVPAALPVAGLLWLRAQDPARRGESAVVTAFRVVALTEAVTWLGLLVGMWFKYVADAGDGGVRVFGPAHGAVFLAYVAVALVTWRHQRWSLPVAALALAAAVPPFGTLVFEEWVRRTGRLRHRAGQPTAEPARGPVG